MIWTKLITEQWSNYYSICNVEPPQFVSLKHNIDVTIIDVAGLGGTP